MIRDVDLLHVKMLDDIRALHGIGPIQAARFSVDGAVAAERFAQDYWNDPVPKAVLETSNELTEQQATLLRAQWTAARAGKQSTAVLENGMVYKPIQLSNADAQYIESRHFSAADMARLFGIPAPLLNASTAGSGTLQYRNQEGLATEFATFAVQPITERIEAAFQPLIPSTQEIRFDFTKLLRADSTTRYAVYQVALSNGILTINEVRNLEGLPPLPGGGDVPATSQINEGAAAAATISEEQ